MIKIQINTQKVIRNHIFWLEIEMEYCKLIINQLSTTSELIPFQHSCIFTKIHENKM